jgi:hygromycin-B 4-O-kinase
MKSHLPPIDEATVKNFLERNLKLSAENVVLLSGGKHSLAFGYTTNATKYVVRFNQSDRGFLKDNYAYENFNTNEVPIPKIFSIGEYTDGVYYCISEMVEGTTPKDQYKNGDFSSLPLQFEMIEKIKDFKIPKEYSGYGELEIVTDTRFATLESYLMNIYTSRDVFNWEELRKLPFFDQSFVDYLVSKVQEFSKFSESVRVVLHGDFGNDNIFINDRKVTGIIDWERLRFADHFIDVGRVVLFCPNREETVRAVLSFYHDKGYEHYRERIMLGVYFAMLRNYGAAATEGNEASCASAKGRIEQIEKLIGL